MKVGTGSCIKKKEREKKRGMASKKKNSKARSEQIAMNNKKDNLTGCHKIMDSPNIPRRVWLL